MSLIGKLQDDNIPLADDDPQGKVLFFTPIVSV